MASGGVLASGSACGAVRSIEVYGSASGGSDLTGGHGSTFAGQTGIGSVLLKVSLFPKAGHAAGVHSLGAAGGVDFLQFGAADCCV